VVISSLRQGHPQLALANVLGSCTANILGSFSLGLIFAKPEYPLVITVDDLFSARLYSTVLLVVGILVVVFGVAMPPLYGNFSLRWSGIVLLVIFAAYTCGILYGIATVIVTAIAIARARARARAMALVCAVEKAHRYMARLMTGVQVS
jgi:Ca2+/Na+ antiporter